MMRIVVQMQSPNAVVLEVHGRVAGPNIEVLAAEGQCHLATADRLVLVLDGVQFVDEGGLALLQRWSGPRLTLRGGSAFVQTLLSSQGLALEP